MRIKIEKALNKNTIEKFPFYALDLKFWEADDFEIQFTLQ